ncbi:hypothetical protein [Variovorax sp. JS1663]|uniref:hypothetical protein n=1 Tax=Variovorax sp. JS1663 TaxID=1851577 RepID=UPI001EDF23C8|nr:hypothetical protein [Variovorax sp. JS1663]
MLATIGGAFYPDGYSMVMFPDEASAIAVADDLNSQNPEVEIFHLPPASILSQITPTVSDADNPLPSAGTEGATVRAYTKLAREGHHGLLVETPDEKAADWLMQAVRKVPYSMAQRYRMLVIEDL